MSTSIESSPVNTNEQYSSNKVSNNIVDTDHTLATQGDIVLSGGIAVLYLFMNLLSDLAQYKYLEMQQKAKVSRDAQNMANEVNEIIAEVSKQSNPDTARRPLPADVIKYMEENDVKVDDKTIDQYLDEAAGKGSGQVPEGGAWYQTADGKRKVWVYDDSHGQWFVAGGNQTDDVHNGQKVNKPFVNSDGKVQFDFEINHQTFQMDGRGGDMHGTDPRYIPPGTQFYLVEPTPSDRAHIGLNKGQLDAVKSALENTSNRASDFVSQSQLQLQKVMQTYNVTVSLINSMQTLLEEMNKSIAQNIR